MRCGHCGRNIPPEEAEITEGLCLKCWDRGRYFSDNYLEEMAGCRRVGFSFLIIIIALILCILMT